MTVAWPLVGPPIMAWPLVGPPMLAWLLLGPPVLNSGLATGWASRTLQ